MPQPARLLEPSSTIAPSAGSVWSGDLHGEVGAMHRSIQQRLLSDPFALAVVPLPARPLDHMLSHLSRITGWAVLAVMTAGVATGILTFLS